MSVPERLGTEYADGPRTAKSDRFTLVSALICALLILLILYSFYVRIRMYMLGITLWADEAKLAENIVDRSMWEMLTQPLVNRQTAPVLYLILVKALTMLFGASEAVLRAPSFAALVGMLVVQAALLRKVFRLRFVFILFSVALSSVFLYYMQHSNELKSYMGDAMFVLVVLLGYHAWRKGKLGPGARGALLFSLICIVSMLFSSPAVFAAGAVYIVEFLAKCRRKDQKAILLAVLGGAVFLAVFALNYYFWLRPVATDVGMVDYWEGFKFDFMLYRKEALLHNFAIFKDVFAPIWQTAWITIPFAAAGFVVSLARRNVFSVVVGVFFVLLLAASAIDKYPIANRLWMFVYVIIFIYCFVFIDALRTAFRSEGFAKAVPGKAIPAVIPLFFAVLLFVPNYSFPAYGNGEEWTLTPGDQAKPLIAYLRGNIREGEALYSYHSANAILKYENGYRTNRIGDVSGDNIIYGAAPEGDAAAGAEGLDREIAMIDGIGSAYILYYHSYTPLSRDWYIDYTAEQLQKRGYMDAVMDVYHTPLYWYANDLSAVRASISYGLSGLETEGGALAGALRIENTGETILAHDRFDNYGQLYVVLRKAGGGGGGAGAGGAGSSGDSASSIDSGDSGGSASSIDSGDPIDSGEAGGSIDSGDSIDSGGSGDSGGSIDSVGSGDSGGSGDSASSGNPGNSASGYYTEGASTPIIVVGSVSGDAAGEVAIPIKPGRTGGSGGSGGYGGYDGYVIGIVIGEIATPIKPGESVDLLIEASGLAPGDYEIEIVAYREYAFSALGVPTIPVTVR